jgi:hypothetical protein
LPPILRYLLNSPARERRVFVRRDFVLPGAEFRSPL